MLLKSPTQCLDMEGSGWELAILLSTRQYSIFRPGGNHLFICSLSRSTHVYWVVLPSFRQYSRYFKQRDTLDSFYPQPAHYSTGETSQWLRCHNHSLQKVLGTQKGTQLSTNVKAASAKGSCLSWVLKEPGTYRTRTGGHWWCRARRSLFQLLGTARRWGRCTSDGVGGADGYGNRVPGSVTT